MIKAEDQTLIRATDLRIGNWVTCYNHTFQVGVLEKTYAEDLNADEGGFAYENIKGIELNEEWLIKLGFTNEIEEELPEDAEFLCFFKDNIDVELEPALMGGTKVVGVTLYEDAVDEDGLHSRGAYEVKADIQFVHQLQNLYHSLTGTELTTKP